MAVQSSVIRGETQSAALPAAAIGPAHKIGKLLTRPATQKTAALLTDLAAITMSHVLAVRILAHALGIAASAQSPFQYHRYYIPYFALALPLIGGYKSLELRRPEQELEQCCKTVAASFLGLVLFNFLVFRSAPFSRYLIVVWFVLATILLVGGRFTLRGVYGMLWKRGLCRRSVLLVGSAEGISEYWHLLRTQRHGAYEHTGVLLDAHSLQSYPFEFLGLPVLGRIREWGNALNKLKTDLVIVTHSGIPDYERWQHELVHKCKQLGVEVELYSGVLATANLAHEHDEYSGCFRFYPRAQWSLMMQRIAKRGLDVAIGLVGSAVTLLLTPIVFLLVNLEDRGPVFHLREYVGSDGRIRYYRKFRTMRKDADEILRRDAELKAQFLRQHKLKEDPRLLRVGRFMRQYSIDEFPQFFSVLFGALTFVGPRVISAEERARYGGLLPKLLSTKPGLTGYWQVMGRQTTTYEERIRMDMFYVERWSIWLDLVILAKTFWKVVKAEGAY